MTWVAHQVIVQIASVDASFVAILERMAKNLELKHGDITTNIMWLGGTAIPALEELTLNNRLYIVAHDNVDGTTAAGLTGVELAGVGFQY